MLEDDKVQEKLCGLVDNLYVWTKKQDVHGKGVKKAGQALLSSINHEKLEGASVEVNFYKW